MALKPPKQNQLWIDRLLDLLAKRTVLAICFLPLFLFGWNSISLVVVGQDSLEVAQTQLQGASVRTNAVAIADVYRLRTVLAHGLSSGGLSESERADFVEAVDFLYVRAQDFRMILQDDHSHPSAARALASMDAIIELSDQALADDFADTDAFTQALDIEIGATISAMTQYTNVRNAEQLAAVGGSLLALQRLTVSQIALIGSFAAFSMVILVLLRREVVSRKHRAIAEERASFLAYYDSLTSLPNRERFTADLTTGLAHHRVSEEGHSALIFVDIDDFKEFNDVYGYLAGDQLLRAVAQKFRTLVDRYGGVAARVAGDEFALFLPYNDDPQLAYILRDVNQIARTGLSVGEREVEMSCSIGVVTTQQVARSAAPTARNMRQSADFAQTIARNSHGRGNIVVFDDDLAVQMRQTRIRSVALSEALETGGIDVWFQPKVCLNDFSLCGFEALARWKFEGTMIPPQEFVTLAEQNGLISRLDLYMLRHSVLHLADWNKRSGRTDHISVNFSAQHLLMSSVARDIADVLTISGLSPELLTVELTETVEVSDWRIVGDRLQEIIDLGCRLAVDDFGSGYSSLGYLRNIPAHELKIDRSLVADIETSPKARSILSAVVEIAETLEFQTVVEGIETEAQARTAIELGCDLGQGYLFARPMPVADLPHPDDIPTPLLASAIPQGRVARRA